MRARFCGTAIIDGSTAGKVSRSQAPETYRLWMSPGGRVIGFAHTISIRNICLAVKQFIGEYPQHDDMTRVALKVA